MKKFLIGLSFVIICSCKAYTQDYKTHKVQEGETIESIAKAYMVTPYDIYALNPDVKTNFRVNSVLIIPKSKVKTTPEEVETTKLTSYKSHKVRRKETLYSISKKYNITIDDIKKHNTRLYSENLRKGDKINIPVYQKVIEVNTLDNTIKKYTVLPKEGKWRVAYKFGISITELDALNPNIEEVLQVGQEINVPNISANEEKAIDETFGYYTVLPKEGFYRLKVKLGLEQEQLEKLNPALKETGLKDGMILKIPSNVKVVSDAVDVESTSLASKISNYNTKKLAILLPFRLNRVDLDSIKEVKNLIQHDAYLGLSLDFHSGVLMALDSAKQLGISTKLDVFDTKSRVSEVSKIISDNDFSDYDAVIGPITSDNFDRAASILKRNNIPVISPLTKPKELYSNVFQTIPSDDLLKQRILKHVSADTLVKHIIIISDLKNRAVSNSIKKAFPLAKQLFSKVNDKGVDLYYILKDKLEEELKEGRNIVFLETSNEGFVSSVSSMLNAFNGRVIDIEEELDFEREIILYTTNKNRAFEGNNISNYDLSNLQFHFPSVNKSFDYEIENNFVKSYKVKYGAEPNRYATRGFDLTFDLLLRLSTQDDLFDASSSDIETEYIENKFRYSKKLFGGYINEASYIMKYEDLKLIEVKQ